MKSATKKTYGLNLEVELIKRGSKRAKTLRQSFSAYVNTLIARDTCEVSANNTQAPRGEANPAK